MPRRAGKANTTEISSQCFSLLFFAFNSNKNELATVQVNGSFRVPQRGAANYLIEYRPSSKKLSLIEFLQGYYVK